MPKFRVIVNETNTVVYEIEDKITSESVTDWDVDFVEEI